MQERESVTKKGRTGIVKFRKVYLSISALHKSLHPRREYDLCCSLSKSELWVPPVRAVTGIRGVLVYVTSK
jgi:hypothetical protein